MELLFPLILLFWCVSAMIGIASLAMTIWMLIDCLSNEPSEGNDKLIWMLVIIFVHGIGALLYYFIRRPERIKEHEK